MMAKQTRLRFSVYICFVIVMTQVKPFICTVLQIRKGNWDNIVMISLISSQKHLVETVLMRGHNICCR